MSSVSKTATRVSDQRSERKLRIAYTIQNARNINFSQDVGDTVPVKQTLLGLQRSGHEVTCFRLGGRQVFRIENVVRHEQRQPVAQGLPGTKMYRIVESGLRRIHRELRLPYLALFDSHRFYEAALRAVVGYDLCHEHSALYSFGTALACRRLGMPYVLTVSADPLLERAAIGRPMGGLSGWVAARVAAFTYRQAHKILCVSEPARQHLARNWYIDPSKIVVMANGVDTELFSPEKDIKPVRRRWAIDERPVIGFVGGFQPWHGLDLLIDAVRQVRVQIPDVVLLLVGDGRARPIVDAAVARHGMEDSVIVTGFLPQVEIPAQLAVMDVTVLPYPKLPSELWFSPLKMYEYMAAGKAIVATRSGQIADVIVDGETGRLAEPGDVLDLTRILVELLQDPAQRQRLGHAARVQAVRQHSWEPYISRLEQVYYDVLQ